MPAGTSDELTFFFSDIVDSTGLWERHSGLMGVALALHDELAIGAIEIGGGRVFKHTGDGIAATFRTGEEAVRAAVSVQRALATAPWPPPLGIAVRIGLHHGSAEARAGDFFGRAVNWAARIMSAANPGQVLVSDRVRLQFPDDFEFAFRDEGPQTLRGVSERVRLHSVDAPGLVCGLDLAVPEELSAPQAVPVALTGLIGRTVEVERVAALVAPQRVVTVAGPPGIGKTRLAIEVAADAADNWPQGVQVVELASVEPDDDIAAVVAERVLGAEPLADGSRAIERLTAADLGQRLIVLDNCEHVLSRVIALVETVFASAPNVGILATSRERLGLSAEEVVSLQPLTMGGRVGDMPAAVQLFVQRARQAGARVDADHMELVQQICTRLDGVPLAIELAAARLNVLDLADLNDRLFEVLTTRRRRDSRIERHGTITDAVAWSWGLLEDDERLVLCRASVFADSFALDAATMVCGGDDFDVFDVMDILGSLRDRSFLSQVYVESGNRFRLLEIIRSFAAAKHDPEDRAQTQARHQSYFLQHAKSHMYALDDKPEPSLMTQLRHDDANYSAAVTLTEGACLQQARRLAVRLLPYWRESGRAPAGFRYIKALLEPADEESTTWWALLGSLVTAAVIVGELREAESWKVKLAEAASGEVTPFQIPSYFALGFSGIAQGEFLQAADWFGRTATAARGLDTGIEREALMIEGACHGYESDPATALAIYARAEAVPPPEQGWFGQYHAVFVASARLQQNPGSPERSRWLASVEEGLVDLSTMELGFRLVIAVNQATLGLATAGAVEELDRWWPVAVARARRGGHRWGIAVGVEVGGWSAAFRGRDQLAVDRWAMAETLVGDGGYGFGSAHRDMGRALRELVADRSPGLVATPSLDSDLGRFVDAMIAVESLGR